MTSLEHAATLLRTSHTVAVLGAHPTRYKAAYYVPEYLQEHGYRILPVNPRHAGTQMFGSPVAATLAELEEAVDLVDVFRRSEHLPDHVGDLLAMDPLPGVVWFQLGIRNEAVAARLREAGIEVVQDRCTLADHRQAGLTSPSRG